MTYTQESIAQPWACNRHSAQHHAGGVQSASNKTFQLYELENNSSVYQKGLKARSKRDLGRLTHGLKNNTGSHVPIKKYLIFVSNGISSEYWPELLTWQLSYSSSTCQILGTWNKLSGLSQSYFLLFLSFHMYFIKLFVQNNSFLYFSALYYHIAINTSLYKLRFLSHFIVHMQNSIPAELIEYMFFLSWGSSQ